MSTLSRGLPRGWTHYPEVNGAPGPFGPQYIEYAANYSTSLNVNARLGIDGRAEPTRYVSGTPNDPVYPQGADWGAWDMTYGKFAFDQPGLYRMAWFLSVTLSGTPAAMWWIKTQVTVPAWNLPDLYNDWIPMQGSSGGPVAAFTEYVQTPKFVITPEQVERAASFARAWTPNVYIRRPSGSETVTAWNNTFTVERWSGEAHVDTWSLV